MRSLCERRSGITRRRTHAIAPTRSRRSLFGRRSSTWTCGGSFRSAESRRLPNRHFGTDRSIHFRHEPRGGSVASRSVPTFGGQGLAGASPASKSTPGFGPRDQLDLALVEFTKAPGNLLVPRRFRAFVYLLVEAVDEGTGQGGSRLRRYGRPQPCRHRAFECTRSRTGGLHGGPPARTFRNLQDDDGRPQFRPYVDDSSSLARSRPAPSRSISTRTR